MGRIIGYARVSKLEQNLDLQKDELEKAGVKKQLLFIDKVSGMKEERPGLARCFENLQHGDVLVVWRLDRLGRSLPHLISIIKDLKERGVGFRSIADSNIDTTTASGEVVFNIFSSLAQFERSLLQERTLAGLKSARARGRLGGRPKLLKDSPKIKMAKKLHEDKSLSIAEICQTMKISKSALYWYLKQ
jgi:DNA invertase Pin-like site-specific DNA recombinase